MGNEPGKLSARHLDKNHIYEKRIDENSQKNTSFSIPQSQTSLISKGNFVKKVCVFIFSF